jgi:hypothetical protein
MIFTLAVEFFQHAAAIFTVSPPGLKLYLIDESCERHGARGLEARNNKNM